MNFKEILIYKMEQWKLTKKIVGICHLHNGTIFGGCVRDSYIHDHDAHKFYQGESETGFLGRFVVPNDIDCLILSQDHQLWLERIQRDLHVRILDVDANDLGNVPPGKYKFIRYSIVQITGEHHINVQVDMIIQLEGELILPFYSVDMDVNTLLWTKNSITINPSALPFLSNVYGTFCCYSSVETIMIYTSLFEQIISKKAHCSSDCSSRRIVHMKKQGWKIHYAYYTIQISNTHYDGVCVLCQDTIVGDHSTFQCKCAHICMDCLQKHYEALPRCTICKREVDGYKLWNEIRIYNAIECGIDFDRRCIQN